MRFRYKKPPNKEEWHSWFAWHPVVVGDDLVWLERVERKGEYFSNYSDNGWDWEYRNIKEFEKR